MIWIKESEKTPRAHKPFFGLYRTSYGELRPIIFCRRGLKKDKLYQGWYDLNMYKIEYWGEIDIPNEK